MYNGFYNFTEEPFNITPDPRFLFLTDSHREALSSMIYGIRARKGFIMISGEVGTGKTTLLYYLRKVLHPSIKTVFISQIKITLEDLFQEILSGLDLPFGDGNIAHMTRQLNARLQQTLTRGENLALLIDEAQSLSKETLEGLRMLSNIETGESKLMQTVLVGQPELERTLNAEDLRHLKQRIGIRRKIRTITEEECRRYIEHRLKKAGSSSAAIFSSGALSLICKCSEGIMRNTNILCDNALLIGYATRQKRIDESIVKEVLGDLGISVPQEQARPKVLYVPRGIPRESAGDFLLAQDTEKPSARRSLSPWVFYPFLAVFFLALSFFLGSDYIARFFEPSPQKYTIARQAISQDIPPAAPSAAGDGSSASPESRPPGNPPKITHKMLARLLDATALPQPVPDFLMTEAPANTGKKPIRIVETGGGDSLSSISQKYYNRANITLIDHILAFNPKIENMEQISVSQKIELPGINEESFLTRSPENGYWVHLGTFDYTRAAERYRKEPALQGKRILVVHREVSPDTTWYRLLAGKFETKEDAVKAVKTLKKKNLLPAFSNGG